MSSRDRYCHSVFVYTLNKCYGRNVYDCKINAIESYKKCMKDNDFYTRPTLLINNYPLIKDGYESDEDLIKSYKGYKGLN